MYRDPVIAGALALAASHPPRGLLASTRPLVTPPEELLHRLIGLGDKLALLQALDDESVDEVTAR